MALQVVETEPRNSENNVYLDKEIEIKFNDAVNVNTLNKSNFHIFDNAKAVNGKISYTPEDQKATFKPSEKLSPDQQYRIVLDSDIMSTDGNRLNSYTSTFRTIEDGYSLKRPVITHPTNNEKVGEPFIRWEPVYGANSYSIEVSTDNNFNNPDYSATVFHKSEVNPTLKSNREYYIRMKANEVVDDDGETVEEKLLFEYDDLIYLGNNTFQIDISSEYTPLESLISIRVHDTDEVFTSDYVNPDDVKTISVAKSGFSDTSDTKIISQKRGVVQFKYPLEEDKTIEVIFNRYEKIVDSPWTDTVRFFYDKGQINFEELIEMQTGQEKFMEINKKIQVDPDIEKIFFKLYYGYLTEEDVDVDLEGNHVNNMSSIDMGKSHGMHHSDTDILLETELKDWMQLTDNRFEYQVPNEKTPILEFKNADIGNYNFDEINIVDKKRGIVSINEDIISQSIEHIKDTFSTALDDLDLVDNYYIEPVYIDDDYYVVVDLDGFKEDYLDIESKLPDKILGIKVKYNYNLHQYLDGYTDQINNYFEDINLISNYTSKPILKDSLEIKNVSPEVKIDTEKDYVIVAQVHYSDYDYGSYKSVNEFAEDNDMKTSIDNIPIVYTLNTHLEIPYEVNGVYKFVTKSEDDQGKFTTKKYNDISIPYSFSTISYKSIDEIKYDIKINLNINFSKLKVVETNENYTIMRLIL